MFKRVDGPHFDLRGLLIPGYIARRVDSQNRTSPLHQKFGRRFRPPRGDGLVRLLRKELRLWRSRVRSICRFASCLTCASGSVGGNLLFLIAGDCRTADGISDPALVHIKRGRPRAALPLSGAAGTNMRLATKLQAHANFRIQWPKLCQSLACGD